MDFKRGKSKNKSNYTNRDIYSFFIKYTKIYPRNTKRKQSVSEKTFLRVFKKFSDRVTDEVVNNFFLFKMPYNLGSIYITSYKHKYTIDETTGKLKIIASMIDIVATRELWKSSEEDRKNKTIVIKDYSNTDNIAYKIKWSKPNSKFVNNKFYALKPSRIFKTKIYTACENKTITSYN
jgi:hypothetical protein